MNRVLLEIIERSNLSRLQPPPLHLLSQSPPSPPPPPPSPYSFNLDSKLSPSILLIIIILAIIFFISGILHLLVRCLLKPPNTRDPDDFDNVTALQGQLQQLFHLHDSGVDQTFIDALPVFHYKSIIGVKDPFDCAVCLCEFEADDKLRLLPKCSHAFHMDCIDTWLLSHSTCPLCRSSLLHDFPSTNGNNLGNYEGCLPTSVGMPIVCVLESGSDSSREIGVSNANVEKEGSFMSFGFNRSNSRRSGLGDGEFVSGSSRRKSCEIHPEVSSGRRQVVMNSMGDQKQFSVKLGKFRNLDGVVEEGSSKNNNFSTSGRVYNNNSISNQNNNVVGSGSRRCYSMGSFAYVCDEDSSLQVPVSTLVKMKKKASKKPLKPDDRSAMSEYGSDSRREFNGVDAFTTIDHLSKSGGLDSTSKGKSNARIGNSSRKESFSISKIWLRGDSSKRSKVISNVGSSKREVSSRFCVQQNTSNAAAAAVAAGPVFSKSGAIGTGGRKSTDSVEFQMEDLESGRQSDEETQSCYSMDSQANPTSSSSYSTRRTLHWLLTKQNKVVYPSSSNV